MICSKNPVLARWITVWRPGSDIRTMPRQARLRMSEPKGHQQILDSSVDLDLTFVWRTRGNTETNVKSTTLAAVACEAPNRIKEAGYRRKQEGAFWSLKKAYQPIDIPRKYAPSNARAGRVPQALRILGQG
jgi:hypothetical protein